MPARPVGVVGIAATRGSRSTCAKLERLTTLISSWRSDFRRRHGGPLLADRWIICWRGILRILFLSNKARARKVALPLAAAALVAAGLVLLSACSSGSSVAPATPAGISKAQQSALPAAQQTKAGSTIATPTVTNSPSPQLKTTGLPEKAATVGPIATTTGSVPAPIQQTAVPSSKTPAPQTSLSVPVPTNPLQKNQAGNVTIDVTWEGNQASIGALRFAVVMDTHSVDLDKYDLSKLATLRNDKGREVTPTTWDGPPGGGHHRSGVLVFPTTEGGKPLIDAETKFVELTIRDVANVKERVLRWEF